MSEIIDHNSSVGRCWCEYSSLQRFYNLKLQFDNCLKIQNWKCTINITYVWMSEIKYHYSSVRRCWCEYFWAFTKRFNNFKLQLDNDFTMFSAKVALEQQMNHSYVINVRLTFECRRSKIITLPSEDADANISEHSGWHAIP